MGTGCSLARNASDVCGRVMARDGCSTRRTTRRCHSIIQGERTAKLNRLRQILQPVSTRRLLRHGSRHQRRRSVPTQFDQWRTRCVMPWLAGCLPPDRCAAQIGVGAGKARTYQAHPTDSLSRSAAGRLIKPLPSTPDQMPPPKKVRTKVRASAATAQGAR